MSVVHIQKGVVGADWRAAESITKKLVVTATSAVSWAGGGVVGKKCIFRLDYHREHKTGNAASMCRSRAY